MTPTGTRVEFTNGIYVVGQAQNKEVRYIDNGDGTYTVEFVVVTDDGLSCQFVDIVTTSDYYGGLAFAKSAVDLASNSELAFTPIENN